MFLIWFRAKGVRTRPYITSLDEETQSKCSKCVTNSHCESPRSLWEHACHLLSLSCCLLFPKECMVLLSHLIHFRQVCVYYFIVFILVAFKSFPGLHFNSVSPAPFFQVHHSCRDAAVEMWYWQASAVMHRAGLGSETFGCKGDRQWGNIGQ